MRYLLSKEPGVGTLHADPPTAACELAEADEIEAVDELTAAAMLSLGLSAACRHCRPRPEAPTLNTRSHAP